MKPLRCDAPTDLLIHIEGQTPYWLCVDHLLQQIADIVQAEVGWEIRKMGKSARGQIGVGKRFTWKCSQLMEER